MRDEHVDDLIDLYALGALEPDEQGAVDEHLDTCARCRTQLARAKELVLLLAWTPDQHDPPPALHDRLMRRVQQLQRRDGDKALRWWQRLLPPMPGGAAQFAFGLSMAMAALLLVFGLRTAQLQRELNAAQAQLQEQRLIVDVLRAPNARLVSIAQSAGGNGRARLLLNPAAEQGYLVASALPQLSTNQTYQLWLIRDATPVSAGTFSVDEQGVARVLVDADQPLNQYEQVGISVEPAGGSQQPTNVILIDQL